MIEHNFSKSYRLTSRKDFQYLRNFGKKFSTPLLLVIYQKSRIDSSHTRIGIGVRRKVGNAVVRNQIKKLVKESFRKSDYRDLGLDVLWIINPRKAQTFGSISDLKIAIRNDLFYLLYRLKPLSISDVKV